MIPIPNDIYSQIVRYVGITEQARFRSACSYFNTLPILIEQCCKEPTTNEVLNWIFTQSELLRNPETRNLSILKPDPNYMLNVFFMFANEFTGHNVMVRLDVNTGALYNNIITVSHPNYKYDMTNPGLNSQWFLIRNVLASRLPCRKYLDICFLRLIIKYINIDSIDDLWSLGTLLNPITLEEFIQDFMKTFEYQQRVPLEDRIPLDDYFLVNIKPDFQKVTLWAKQWFAKNFQFADLAQSPLINYSSPLWK